MYQRTINATIMRHFYNLGIKTIHANSNNTFFSVGHVKKEKKRKKSMKPKMKIVLNFRFDTESTLKVSLCTRPRS